MNVQADEEQLELPAILDLAAAEGLLDLLRQGLERGAPLLRLDASAVEVITLPCMQVILAAAKGGGRLSIEQPSIEFVTAFENLGLDWTAGQAARSEPVPEQMSGPGEDKTNAQPAGDGQGPNQNGATPENEAAGRCLTEDQTSEVAMTKRILTIDDSKTMRDMLKVTLSDAGFDVLQGVDGQDGLNVLGEQRVDVVITDINMPIMDGYEVIRQLRRNPLHKSTPILVLTTESDTEKRQLARDAGATGWMVKPFDPDRLIATVRKVSP